MKNKFFLLALAILFFSLAAIFRLSISEGVSVDVTDVEHTLHKKESRLNSEMLTLAKRAETQNYNQLFIQKPDYYTALLEKEGLALLIYENDTLKFWSDNSIAVENWMREVCLDTKMAKLRNGWFEVMKPPTNATTTKTIVGLALIKNEYPYQNNYLANEFQKDFNLPAETKLLINNPKGVNQVKNFNNEYLFSLDFNPSTNTIGLFNYLALFLNLAGFFSIFLFIKNACLSLQTRIGRDYAGLLFVALIIIFRYLTIKLALPGNFYDFELFNPKVYADASSVWLTSLGDLLINIILLFYLTFFLISEGGFDGMLIRQQNSRNKFLLSLIFVLVFFWFSWIITTLFTGLIKNSNISFSINNLFSLSYFSFVALFIFGLLLFIYFLFADKLVFALKQFELNTKHYFLIFLITTVTHALISYLQGSLDLIILFWPFILIVSIALIKQKQSGYPFSGTVFLVFLFSLFAVYLFIKHTAIKENESRKIYAEKLAAEQDPVAELLFQDISKKVQNDSILISYISGSEKKPLEFEKRLKQHYFSGFWEKYDIRVALFDSSCAPVIKSQNPLFDNNLYFDELISDQGLPTSCDNFSFLNNASGKISYLAKLPILRSLKTHVKFGTLFIELDAKFISDEIGFPELLLDRNIGLSKELGTYSYAKYKHNQLVNQYGKFPYSLIGNYFEHNAMLFSFIELDGFNHLLYRPDNETLIVLSKRQEGMIDDITRFSYLFSFFSLLLLFLLIVRQASRGALFDNFSFKYRIQILLVFIVLTSLALFGGGTVYYIRQQFEKKNSENISEKIHSVLIDFGSKLENENALSASLSEYTSFILQKSSNIFFTDINLYDAKGNLYASSRPKVFDEGLTSKKMNPEAFLQMAVLGKSEFIHDERIGKLEYLSAYLPFKNKDGKLLAYLNLPYFAKQSELEKEISAFLVALINIYVLLFALSIVTAIFISNYVTKPLKLIQDKLSKIKLGKTNELIEWHEKDEIGNLISEYNRMILELSKSAELLAKSERESAWREMAKQVAHEIKNPLTPMKLSVQHLQRTWKDHAPDMDQKMDRLTKTIIEQIDTLSAIATEFANFAKMPKANLEKTNVQQLLLNAIDLYRGSGDIEIIFHHKDAESAFVLADKEQLLRVFNNLLKNAIQSIPEDRKGTIEIDLGKENESYVVSIKDNGVGISNDIIDKIFVPNFTTKTGGMGLGLAMVKSIVETFNGKIRFETTFSKGSEFFVSLPCYNEDFTG